MDSLLNHLSVLQIILICTSLAFLVNGLVKFIKKEKSQTFFKMISNTLIWGSIFVFSVIPQSARVLTHYLGFGENLNTLIFIGFIMVFAILFKIINIIERVERNISEIVRKEALESIEKK